jgi:sulfur carrier protein ThiS
MRIEVWIERGNRKRRMDVADGTTVADVMDRLGIVPESVVCLRNGEVVLEDEVLADGDRLRLRPVKIPG